MDALSSVRMMVAPDYATRVNNPAQDLAAKKISLPELQKLDTAGAAQPLDQTAPSYSFENVLGGFVNEVAAKQAAAGDAVKGLISGQNVSLHQTMISMEEASV